MRRIIFSLTATLFLSSPYVAYNQNADSSSSGTRVDLRPKIISGMQLWSTYSFGNRSAAPGSLDMYIRRGRLGIKGELSNFIYTAVFSFDGLGRNAGTAGFGKPFTSFQSDLFIWDAYGTYKLLKSRLCFTAGWFRPQIGREHTTSAFYITSHEKAITQYYLRRNIIGRSSGRELGVDAGGELKSGNNKFTWHLGAFNTSDSLITGSETTLASFLYTGRVVFEIGDPENNQYQICYRTNHESKRKGVSVGVSAAMQGKTNETWDNQAGYAGGFLRNSYIGADVLWNHKGLNLDAEIAFMQRKFSNSFFLNHEQELLQDYFGDAAAHLRVSYNLNLGSGVIAEPCLLAGFSQPSSIFPDDYNLVFDAGVNFHFINSALRLNLHFLRYGSNFPYATLSQPGNSISAGMQVLL